MKNIILVLSLILSFNFAFAQSPAYRISFVIPGYPDSIAFLGNYFGDKLSVADTSTEISEEIVFSGTEPLPQGVYFFVSGTKKWLFEFLVGEDQEFKLISGPDGSPENMSVEGSEDNLIFYEYLRENKRSYQQVSDLHASLKNLEKGSDSARLVQEKIDSINRHSIEYKLHLMDEYPSSMTALLFRIMKEPEVPDFFSDNGRQDSLSAYLYYRNHYWDGIDFSDDRYLRTPVFHRKLVRYMDDVAPKHPDSLINEIDQMISNTEGNTEMRDYLLWYFTNTYETSKVMGYDKIFVHMVDEYFTTQTYEWLHPTVQQNMIDRVNKLRGVLIGETAPPLLMADTSNRFVSMHQINADYLVVFFWSSTCGECKSEVEDLEKLLETTDRDIRVYAVNTDTAFSGWKKFIRKHELDWTHVNGNLSLSGDYHNSYDIYSTPVFYILDDKKKIIAKRISAGNIGPFLQRFEKSKN